MISLNRRLLISATIVLAVFLGSTGLVLDRAFTRSAEASVQDRLQSQIFALLAAADFIDQSPGIRLPDSLPEPRLSTPQSGLYARLYGQDKKVLWSSPSAIGLSLPVYTSTKTGKLSFERLQQGIAAEYFSSNMRVVWEGGPGQQYTFVFQVYEDLSIYSQQIRQYRKNLWGWLLGVTILLLAAQGTILRWSLKPLRAVAQDLDKVKSGEQDHLRQDYPAELAGLTQGINTFIDTERSQRERYRNTLGDLAHSLKTPLAVLRTGLEGQKLDREAESMVQEQIERMKQIVEYQLQRAATSGRKTLGASVALLPHVDRIVQSLQKVNIDRGIYCEVDIDENLMFPGEEGDLFELAGNLLENAFKWACTRICIYASITEKSTSGRWLLLRVEDDGPGISLEQRPAVLQRGIRADQSVSGHGIGLSVVRDIVEVYGGELHLDDSPLGGARVDVVLPVL